MKNKSPVFFLFLLMLSIFGLFPTSTVFAANDFITSVDVMKYTKDMVRNQFTDAQIEAVVNSIVINLKPKYIAISVPLDDSADYPANSKPAPRTSIAFTQKWVDIIHSHGVGVIFRGTWSGIEGIYNFPKRIGVNRFPAGTATSAATDGNSTWLGKTYQYIMNNPNLFSANDIWAVLPERTEGIFQDQTSFLNYPNIQSNYANFFIDLNNISAAAFAKIGKNVKVGYSSNNFSEIASTWMLPSLYANQTSISVDHYGINHTPQEMESDLRSAYKKYGKPLFLQEWGDYWDTALSSADRTAYLNSMYAVFAKLASEKILIGFNYWGGWINDAEGILNLSSGTYGINSRGQLLANFFTNFNSSVSTNTIPPPPPNISPVSSILPPPQPTPAPVAISNPPPPITPPVSPPTVTTSSPPPAQTPPAVVAPAPEVATNFPNLLEPIPAQAQAANSDPVAAKQPSTTAKILTLAFSAIILGFTLIHRFRAKKI